MNKILYLSLVLNCLINLDSFSQDSIYYNLDNIQVGDSIKIRINYYGSIKNNPYKILLIRDLNNTYNYTVYEQDSNKIIWLVSSDVPPEKREIAKELSEDLTFYPNMNPKQQKRLDKKYKKYNQEKWFKVEFGFVEIGHYNRNPIKCISIPKNASKGRLAQDRTELFISYQSKTEKYIISGFLYPDEIVFE